MSTIVKKICLIGDFNVGKTSLIRRFIDRSFSDQYLTTVGVKISRKLICLKENVNLQLVIWDLEGQTKFKAITPTYLQGSMGAIIVADVTRIETVVGLSHHCSTFLSINPQKPIVVALNKVDLLDEQTLKSILLNTELQDCTICQTSAKTGENVDEMFTKLSSQMVSGVQ